MNLLQINQDKRLGNEDRDLLSLINILEKLHMIILSQSTNKA